MLTGTPLDLTAFGSALRAVGVLYWLMAIIAVGAALWWTPRWFGKLAAALVVVGAFSRELKGARVEFFSQLSRRCSAALARPLKNLTLAPLGHGLLEWRVVNLSADAVEPNEAAMATGSA